MLQQKVMSILQCLLGCENADQSTVYGSAGFLWPAFIAACEAEEPQAQVSFSIWFKKAAQKTGLSTFTGKLEIIEQIWDEKRSGSGVNATWTGIMEKHYLSRS